MSGCTSSARTAVGGCGCCPPGVSIDYVLVICNSNFFQDDNYDVYIDGTYIDHLDFSAYGCTGKAWGTNSSIDLSILDLSAANPDDGGRVSDGLCCDSLSVTTVSASFFNHGGHTLLMKDVHVGGNGSFGVVVLARVYQDGFGNWCVVDYLVKSIYRNSSHTVAADNSFPYSVPCPPTSGNPCTLPCSPCPIPKANLCLRWINPVDGNGTATIAYNASTQIWDTGCVNYNGTQSFDFIMKCVSGSLYLEVDGDEDDAVCSTSRTYTLGSGLTLSSSTCSPFRLAITPSGRLNTRQNFSAFYVTKLPCAGCWPCTIPGMNLTCSWTGTTRLGTGPATLALSGSVWTTGCVVLTPPVMGGDPGESASITLGCGSDGTIYWTLNYSAGSATCLGGSYGGRTSVTGTLDVTMLTSYTCSPFVLTYTVPNPSALYTFGLRTVTITL